MIRFPRCTFSRTLLTKIAAYIWLADNLDVNHGGGGVRVMVVQVSLRCSGYSGKRETAIWKNIVHGNKKFCLMI